jgi:Overcoming lysogenization defect protein-like, TOPRIM domain
VPLDLESLTRVRTVLLVEGESDKAALEALAVRTDRVIGAGGTAIVAMGGVTNIGRYLRMLGPRGLDMRVGGLCDEGEEAHVRRAMAREGLGPCLSRAQMEARGFFVCASDLEDELIRALGADAVQQVIARQGELRSLRILQRQPAQLGRSVESQLHRFMGARSGRKALYARLLVQALGPRNIPRPLDRALPLT